MMSQRFNQITEGSWYVTSASRTGTRHRKDGTACQDRLLVKTDDGTLLIAIADGLGSAINGGAGAEAAVEAAMSLLVAESCLLNSPDPAYGMGCESQIMPEAVPADVAHGSWLIDWTTTLTNAVTASREAVLSLHAQHGGHHNDWATTLTLVAADAKRVYAAQIGDCYAVLWSPDDVDTSSRVLAYETTDLDAGEVVPLTASTALNHLQLETAALLPTSHLLVATDGIAPILLDRHLPPQPSSRFLAAVVRELDAGRFDPPALAAFLDSDVVCDRTDDDKTIVIARRTGTIASADVHAGLPDRSVNEKGYMT